MPETHSLLRELVLLAGLSLGISLVFGRLRIPAVTGFIVAGVVIGPGGLGLIQDPRTIHTLAEIGVVLLLFTVGLEFSLADLREMGLRTAAAGVLQIVLTAALVAPILMLAGLHPAQAVFFGLAVAISSTTILLKVVSERGELRAPHGRLTMGFSIVQDLSLVPLTLLTPALAAWAGGGVAGRFGTESALHALFVTASSALLIYAAWRWLPWLLGQASRTRSREVFLAAIVFVVLGSAYLSDKVGLSLAVGAFLGGLMLAGSDVSSQAAADLMPFRDTLSSVFFLSIGLLFSPGALAEHALTAAGVTVAVIALKFIAALVASRVVRIGWPVALATAIAVAHVGEFAFVLAQLGSGAGLLPEAWTQVFIASAVMSMLIAPFLVNVAPRWAVAIDARRPRFSARDAAGALAAQPTDPERQNHVIICGFGLNGANVARVLRAVRIPHLVVDQGPEKIATCLAQGSAALLGNAVQPEILERAGIARARALVVALSDPLATRHVTRLARQAHPGVFIVVRTRYVREMDGFYEMGANLVIPEEFETSIEIFIAVLRQFHVPPNIVEAQVTLLRRERYSILRGQRLPGTVVEQLDEILAEGTTEAARVLHRSPAVGRSLSELGLAAESPGCRVVAVVRAGRAITTLASEFRLEAGDTLVLTGAHAEIDAAIERLAPTDEQRG